VRSDSYVRSQFLQNKAWETSDFRYNQENREKVDWRSVGALVRLLWRAAAPGLKPLSLPRARSPGMGEGGDWWS